MVRRAGGRQWNRKFLGGDVNPTCVYDGLSQERKTSERRLWISVAIRQCQMPTSTSYRAATAISSPHENYWITPSTIYTIQETRSKVATSSLIRGSRVLGTTLRRYRVWHPREFTIVEYKVSRSPHLSCPLLQIAICQISSSHRARRCRGIDSAARIREFCPVVIADWRD